MEFHEEASGRAGRARFGCREFDPAFHGKHGRRTEAQQELERDQGQADGDLQRLFYGDRNRALLIVLQGIDGAGKDGTCWHVISAMDPQGVQGAGLQAADAGGARARLPLAHPPARAGQGRGRGVQPLALRGRAGRARAQAGAASRSGRRATTSSTTGRSCCYEENDTTILKFFLVHLEGGAARALQGAARRSRAAMEDQRFRLQGARLLGRLHRGLRGGADALLDEARALVRHPVRTTSGSATSPSRRSSPTPWRT